MTTNLTTIEASDLARVAGGTRRGDSCARYFKAAAVEARKAARDIEARPDVESPHNAISGTLLLVGSACELQKRGIKDPLEALR